MNFVRMSLVAAFLLGGVALVSPAKVEANPCCVPPPVKVNFCACDPCTGCKYDVCACVPACCACEAPCLIDRCTKPFGRVVLSYCFKSCNKRVDVVINRRGRVTVLD